MSVIEIPVDVILDEGLVNIKVYSPLEKLLLDLFSLENKLHLAKQELKSLEEEISRKREEIQKGILEIEQEQIKRTVREDDFVLDISTSHYYKERNQ